jgi:hypothetical protein
MVLSYTNLANNSISMLVKQRIQIMLCTFEKLLYIDNF